MLTKHDVHAQEEHTGKHTVIGSGKPVKSLEAEIIKVTPQMAQQWLEQNIDNRKVSKDGVKKYASDMKNGRWALTGDAIRFDENGVVIDGQHRLLACIDSGTSFTTMVVRGLPNHTKAVIDLGIKRNTGAILGSLGYKDGAKIASTAINLLTIKAGGTALRGRLSTPEVIRILEQHPKLIDSVDLVYNTTRGTTLGPLPALTAAVHYVAAELLGQRERANEFVEVFKTGIPNYPGDAAHALRESIIRRRDKGWLQARGAQLGSICHAWNLFAKRFPIEKFRSTTEAIIEGLDVEKI